MTATGTGQLLPSFCESFESSTTMIKRSVTCATIFSRRWAPPPPLMTLKSGSTSSAPSMVMSMRGWRGQGRQRDTQLNGGGFGGQRAGNGDDSAQVSAAQALGDAAGGEDGGAARAEADDHAGLDELGGVFAGMQFERVDVHGRILRRKHRFFTTETQN